VAVFATVMLLALGWLGFTIATYTGAPEVKQKVERGFGVTVTTTESRAPGLRPFYLPAGAVAVSLILFAVSYVSYRRAREAYQTQKEYLLLTRSPREQDQQSDT
jgi:hypothetical protein